ncbi:MAG: EAL domain-containing protein [Aquabacterium sp.]|nr:EAL domain-containing protein [Aquabacterium sp.]
MSPLADPVLNSLQPTVRVPSSHSDLANAAQAGLCVVQDDGIRYVNPMLAELLDWPADTLVGQSLEAIIAPGFLAHTQLAIQRRLAGHPGRQGQIQCLRRNGSRFDAQAMARRIEFDGRPAILLTLSDIGELSEALRRAGWSSDMLARTELLCRSGSFDLDWTTGEMKLSAGLRALLGLDAGTLDMMEIEALSWVPDEERAFVSGIWRSATPDEPFEFQHRVLCADGRRLVVLHRGVLAADEANGRRGVAILQDITAQREAEQRIQELASQDEVTGLPNRGSLLDKVDAAMHAARWESRGVALLAIDVPRITEINGRMGFGAGDALAMAMAARLREGCAESDAVARLGDAEFALLIETTANESPEATCRRARAVQAALQAPVRLGATDVFPMVAIGIARYPRDGATPDALLDAAQTARLDVTGGAGLALFRPESTLRARRDLEVEAALRQALDGQEFNLHFHPQVDLGDGRICGAEALLRWHSAELGDVSPGEFIPLAERAGLIGVIGEWVLRRVCEQLAAWHQAGLRDVRVAFNLSAMQLQRPDLARHLQSVLSDTGADPTCLGIEITESMLMGDVEQAASVLRAIKALGIEISLDEFGTGSSSLNILSRLPIDVVKVDRSLVHDVTAPTQQVSVTRAIINMAHGLQMKVLAAGVETEGQLRLLVSNGCDQIQGFWFSAPLPADGFAALLRGHGRLPDRFIAPMRGARTLLLVDDEENIVSALKRLLRRDGYQIITAHSAAEGLLRLAEHDVDVILSDQRMPGMTGVEFLRRAKDLYPNTVRMVLSGYTELQSIIDAVNEGAIYRFLTKPWDDQRLREHVAEAFRQKGLADENRSLAQQVATANGDLEALNQRLNKLLVRQRDEAALLGATADGMRGMLDDLPAAVLGVDPDGGVAYANLAAERLLGDGGGLLGLRLADVLPMADGDGSPPGVIELAGQTFQVERGELTSGGGPRGRLLVLVLMSNELHEEPA